MHQASFGIFEDGEEIVRPEQVRKPPEDWRSSDKLRLEAEVEEVASRDVAEQFVVEDDGPALRSKPHRSLAGAASLITVSAGEGSAGDEKNVAGVHRAPPAAAPRPISNIACICPWKSIGLRNGTSVSSINFKRVV